MVGPLTVDLIRERMLRLLSIDPNIKVMLKASTEATASTKIAHELNERIYFIGREELLANVKKLVTTSPVSILYGAEGAGKSCTANEFGHYIVDKGNEYVVRWIMADCAFNYELAFRQLARLFFIPKMEQLEIVDHLMTKLSAFTDKKFLFILDSVEEASLVKDFVAKSAKLAESRVKILITTRHKVLVKDLGYREDSMLEVDFLSDKEINEYLDQCLRTKSLTPERREKLIEVVKSAEAKVSQMKLQLTVNFLNGNLARSNLDVLLNEIKQDSVQNGYHEVQSHLFKPLPSQQQKILYYCSYLEPSFISMTILYKLFKEPDESLVNLRKDGLIEMDMVKRCVKMHKLVQASMISFVSVQVFCFNSNEKLMKER